MADPIYIKDLIKIPEHVGKGDFVLRWRRALRIRRAQ